MIWYAQLAIYLCSLLISFIALSNVEWARITRISRREFVWMAYIVISLAVAFCLATLIINIGNLFLNI